MHIIFQNIFQTLLMFLFDEELLPAYPFEVQTNNSGLPRLVRRIQQSTSDKASMDAASKSRNFVGGIVPQPDTQELLLYK